VEQEPVRSAAPTAPFVTPSGEGLALWHLDSVLELKATAAATGGELLLFEQRLPAGSSVPLHVHRAEDEAWYVLDGELLFQVDGTDLHAPAGAFIWAPRGLPHTFRVESDGTRLLGITTPGGFEEFFESTGRPAPSRTLPPPPDGPPDMAAMAAAAHRYGCDILGPPLPAREQ
jgi:quercetin dioxygenase-like cupin family protein